jgi:hypothetical protein
MFWKTRKNRGKNTLNQIRYFNALRLVKKAKATTLFKIRENWKDSAIKLL